MASFPRNFLCTTAIKLHYRVFLIPWIKSNSSLSCAKGRGYCSSFPVKYIPKKSSISGKNEPVSFPEKYLEEQEKHNSPKLNAHRDKSFSNSHGRFSYIVSKSRDNQRMSDIYYGLSLKVEEDIKDDFIAVNDELTKEPEEVAEDCSIACQGIQSGQSQRDVEKMVIELLASRPQILVSEACCTNCRAFTALELKKKLQRKRFPLEIVDAVIMDFQSRGLINDSLYAETFSRSRWSSSSWGPRRIKQELFKKGVSEVVAEKAIKIVFENGEDCGDQDSGIAMSKLSIDQLFVQVSKQWMRSHAVPHETRKSRIVRWLQYRGFSWSVIKFVMKKLESECPS